MAQARRGNIQCEMSNQCFGGKPCRFQKRRQPMPDPCAPLTAERRTHLDMELKALGLNRNRISNIILDRFPHTYSRSESVRGMINDWARGARRLTPALQLEIERITKKSLKDLVFGFQETASSPIFETIIQSAAT